jgi:hypothetical protein
MEPYYELAPPGQVDRVDPDGERTALQPVVEQWVGTGMTWGYGGSGPTNTANALLGDATRGTPSDIGSREYAEQLVLSIAFVDDVVGDFDAGGGRIAVREVQAWFAERAEEALSEWRKQRRDPDDLRASSEVQTEEFRRWLEGGPSSDWLAVFRTVHGDPDLPASTD